MHNRERTDDISEWGKNKNSLFFIKSLKNVHIMKYFNINIYK